MNKLRKLMIENDIDMYIVPTGDYHDSEYVSPFFGVRQYLSGFTGSAGTLVITKREAVLFTDGRYFIQAIDELQGSGIELMRMGDTGVPTLTEYIREKLHAGQMIGFNGRVIGYELGESIKAIAREKNGTVESNKDLIDQVWTDRPQLEFHDSLDIDESYFGESVLNKIARVRAEMSDLNADVHILTSLDDIAWLFNIRGNDVACNPVIFAYVMITLDDIILFANKASIQKELEGVKIEDYFQIYNYVDTLDKSHKVLLDQSRVNYSIVNAVKAKAQIINKTNPTTYFKAIKNRVEIENTKKAHIADGVAVTKFMYWLKTNIGNQVITEISASDYLEQLRRECPSLIELSFPTICAYNSNAAMMHYSANEKHNSTLEPKGMLLVDSGGQYLEGTTDITRTFVLGEITDEMKLHYTTITKSMLRLSNAKFLYGCKGINLDILARGPLWDMSIDYKCGTGHGVGHILNVHEGPNGFRWKSIPERNDGAVFEEGMITTNEPGVYIEGSHGIRIENELLCVKGEENEYGQFMQFETLTFAPIDLDGINPEYLDKKDIKQLNDYHKKVYKLISPFLNTNEKKWLKDYTKSILKFVE